MPKTVLSSHPSKVAYLTFFTTRFLTYVILTHNFHSECQGIYIATFANTSVQTVEPVITEIIIQHRAADDGRLLFDQSCWQVLSIATWSLDPSLPVPVGTQVIVQQSLGHNRGARLDHGIVVLFTNFLVHVKQGDL